jgi:hypothetical protein
MNDRVSFCCPSCQTRFRASARFAGRRCACPSCGDEVIVPVRVPEAEPPVLVLDDGHRSASRDAYRLESA